MPYLVPSALGGAKLRSLTLAAVAAFAMAGGAAAQDRAPLASQSEITEGIIAAAIAYEIGEKCESLSARFFRGLSFLNGLKSRARQLGYSEAEINAFMDDRTERRRLETEARARLASMGGVVGQWETYCTVGRAEIAAGTQIGQLLR